MERAWELLGGGVGIDDRVDRQGFQAGALAIVERDADQPQASSAGPGAMGGGEARQVGRQQNGASPRRRWR